MQTPAKKKKEGESILVPKETTWSNRLWLKVTKKKKTRRKSSVEKLRRKAEPHSKIFQQCLFNKKI